MKKLRYTKQEISLMLALFLLAILPLFYKLVFTGEGSIWYYLVCLLASLLFVCVFYSIRNRWVFSILLIPMMFFSGMESFMIIVYQDFIRTGNFLSVMTTNARESSNFGANNTVNLLYTIPAILFCIWAIIMRCKTYKKQNSIGMKEWILSGALFGLSWGTGNIGNPPYNAVIQAAGAGYFYTCKTIMTPEGDDFTFASTRQKHEGREIYVFGVGESLRYDHTSFSGYNRDTTPMLAAEPNLVAYSNYMANGTLTLFAVPMMLSRANADDYYLHYREKSIIEPYKLAGFKTFVISTGKLLAHLPYITRGTDGIIDVSSDKRVAEVIDSISKIYPKTFFIVQMLQCHSYYDNFTPDCDKFHPNLVDDRNVKSEQLYLNAYDNAMLYCDKIMDGIIRTIDQPDCQSAFIYASDHGEILTMHGHRRGNSLTPKEAEYHVPMIFWYSDKWAQTHPQKVANVRKNQKRPTGADNLFYTAVDMADIQLPAKYADEEYSLLSPKFKVHERKLLLPDARSILHIK